MRSPSNEVKEASSPAESHSCGKPSTRSRVCCRTTARCSPSMVESCEGEVALEKESAKRSLALS
jgi:hypothetical protein